MKIQSGYKAVDTKSVVGVEVFAAGEWTDSAGDTYKWTTDDLDAMVQAYNDDDNPRVSLKVGHTSDSFNSKVAEALGIPLDVATGDQDGQGQIALGYVSSLSVEGDKIIADFEGVPEAIADLIEGGQFNAVSSEIDLSHDGSKILSGVALLGVEEPAVKSLARLDSAKVFGANYQGVRVSFALQGHEITSEELEAEFTEISNKMEELIRGKRGSRVFRALWQQMVNNFKGITRREHAENNEQEEMMTKTVDHQEGSMAGSEMVAIAIELGLDESATLGDILRAIKGLQVDMPSGDKEGEGVDDTQMSQENSELITRIEALETENASLKHTSTVSKYRTIATQWKGLEGTPDEIATELAEVEEKLGVEAANKMVARYTASNDAVVKSGILSNVGNAGKENESEHPLMKEMTQWAKDNNTTIQKAYVYFQSSRPDDFRQYVRDIREGK